MKNKKLEKKTLFVFKRNDFTHLTKEQMKKIIGGNSPTTNLSGEPDCENKTIHNQTLSG